MPSVCLVRLECYGSYSLARGVGKHVTFFQHYLQTCSSALQGIKQSTKWSRRIPEIKHQIIIGKTFTSLVHHTLPIWQGGGEKTCKVTKPSSGARTSHYLSLESICPLSVKKIFSLRTFCNRKHALILSLQLSSSFAFCPSANALFPHIIVRTSNPPARSSIPLL